MQCASILRLGHLSIHGWGQELRDYKTKIFNYPDCDLISVNESWLRHEDCEPQIEGFKWIDNRRKTINKRARTGSGGVGILVKLELYRDYLIDISDKAYDGILAITLTNKHTDYKFAFITSYLPPVNSIYGRDSTSFFFSSYSYSLFI